MQSLSHINLDCGRIIDKETKRNCCCVSLGLITFLPPILLTIGLVMMFMNNTRVERILEYNDRVKVWNSYDFQMFKNSSFLYTYINQTKLFTEIIQKGDLFWPVQDNCKQYKDPKDGCMPTQSVYFSSEHDFIAHDELIQIYDVLHENRLILNMTFNPVYFSYLNAHDLQCERDLTLCASSCIKEGGNWEYNKCIIPLYMYDLCYRLRSFNGSFELDYDHPGPIWSRRSIGCYYNNNQWTPARYSRIQPKTFTINLRYFQDPVVSASELTFGCSDTYMNSTNCFGQNKYDQNYSGHAIFIVSLFLIVIEVAIYILLIYSHYSGVNKNSRRTNKNKPQRVLFEQPFLSHNQNYHDLDLVSPILTTDSQSTSNTTPTSFLSSNKETTFTSQFSLSYIPKQPQFPSYPSS